MADPPAGAVVITDVEQVGKLTLEETEDERIETELRTDDFHEFWTVAAEDKGNETDGWDDHFAGEDVEALSDQLSSSIFRERDDEDED
ncbi:hypothetical protein [Kocuria sp. CH-021]|uniref:hypothetical protein n=1 Tax=Kocuria sp. CH-021 TaxID=3406735 RepID=UPI003C7175C8